MVGLSFISLGLDTSDEDCRLITASSTAAYGYE